MVDLVGEQFGNYRLLKRLGSGGFAEVYEAEHIYLGTHAAIKVSFGQLSPQNEQKFREEARTISKLVHPHIVRFLEYGIEKNGMPFFVMDYASNGTLRNLHPQGSLLPLTTILSYVQQVAPALQYAHDEKVIHRDVKPENMLVDAKHNILVSDFGLATVAHGTQSLNTQQDRSGTIYYMAPEQIQGKPRPASDQYALGIIVYEWLCGTWPFDGLSDIEIAMKHIVEPPPSFNKNLKISPVVERIVVKALSKDPGKRYPSVQAFSDALEQAAIQAKKAAKPIPPRPPKPQPPKPQPINPKLPVSSQRHISRKQFLIGAGVVGLGLIGFATIELPDLLHYDSDRTGFADWKGTSDWKVKNGVLINDGSNTDQTSGNLSSLILAPTDVDANFAVEANIKLQNKALNSIPSIGFLIRYTPNNNGYILYFSFNEISGVLTSPVSVSLDTVGRIDYSEIPQSNTNISIDQVINNVYFITSSKEYIFRVEINNVDPIADPRIYGNSKGLEVNAFIDGNLISTFSIDSSIWNYGSSPIYFASGSKVGLIDEGQPLIVNKFKIS